MKRLCVFLVSLVFLFAGCSTAPAGSPAASSAPAPAPSEASGAGAQSTEQAPEPPEALPSQTEETRDTVPEAPDSVPEAPGSPEPPTLADRIADEVMTAEPVTLAFGTDDFVDAHVYTIAFPTGDKMWPIRREENLATLTALITDSALYPCPDDVFAQRQAELRTAVVYAALFFDCEPPYNSSADAAGAEIYELASCVGLVAIDSLGVYVRLDGQYYLPDEARADEIEEALRGLAGAVSDALEELIAPHRESAPGEAYTIPGIDWAAAEEMF